VTDVFTFPFPEAYFKPKTGSTQLISRKSIGLSFKHNFKHKVTLFIAPSGYGKTTLMSQWLEEAVAEKIVCSWVNIDSTDNTLPGVLQLLMTSLLITPGLNETTVNNQELISKPSLEMIISLIEHSKCQILWFWDSLEHIKNKDVLKVLNKLIENLPHNIKLIISSKTTPDWDVVGMMLKDNVHVIQQNDLRFTLAEIKSCFVHEGVGMLDENKVYTIASNLLGWPAIIKLAAVGIKNAISQSEINQILKGDHEIISDFVQRHIFSGLNNELLMFIQQTAHLRKLNVAVCNYVCQHEYSDAYIKQLLDLNILTRSQFSVQTYRYPSFFNRYLSDNFLKQQKNKTEQLYEKALTWNMLNDIPAEALYHALKLTNINIATGVIKKFAKQLIVSGEITLLNKYFHLLPADELSTNPFLKYVNIWTLIITQKFVEAKEEIKKLIKLIDNNTCSEGFEHLTPTEPQLKIVEYRVRQALDPQWAEPAVWSKLKDSEEGANTFLKEQILLSLGSAYLRREQFTEAYTSFLDCKYYADVNGTAITAITALSRMAYIRKIEGHLIEAKDLCEQAIDLSIQNYGTRIPVVAVPLLILSEIEYELNRIDVSEILHLSASKLFEQYNNRVFQVQAIIHGAKLANYYHGPSNAITLLVKAKNIVSSRSDNHLHRLVCAEQIKYHLQTGEVAMAKSLLANEEISVEKRTPNPNFSCSCKNETIYSSFARYLINVGRFADASAWLTKMLHQAKEQKRIHFCVELAGLLALVHSSTGDENTMLRSVRELLFLGEQSNSTRSILDQGEKIITLIKKYQDYYIKVEDQHGPSKSYINDLIKHSSEIRVEKSDNLRKTNALSSANGNTKQLKEAPSINNLTQREIDVLVLICKGYANKSISKELILGVGTVKWHVKNIFAKLYVANRTQAASVGRELGLMD